jgi:chemotaxis response regulator CheB
MGDVPKLTRVLVANTPRLMRDVVVATFTGQPDIEIVGEACDEGEIMEKVRATLPDILVVDLEKTEARPSICDQVLREHPGVSVIAVASREDRTVCYWVSADIHSREVEASPQGLLDAARFLIPGRTDIAQALLDSRRRISTAN